MDWRAEKRSKENAELQLRWDADQDALEPAYHDPENYGLNRCDIFYINLDKRDDRRALIEQEFQKLGVTSYQRFAAIEEERGSLGCAMSHREVTRGIDPAAQRLTMICEDDCQFLLGREEIDAIIEDFANHPRLSALSLAYKDKNAVPITDRLSICSNTQTMSCYILKPDIVGPLLACMDRSVELLAAGASDSKGAVDVRWKQAQRTHFFAIPINRAARQHRSFSDIQGRIVNYGV